MLNSSEVYDGIWIITVNLENILKNWTASTENAPMSPDLLLIISDKCYICKLTWKHHLTKSSLQMIWIWVPLQSALFFALHGFDDGDLILKTMIKSMFLSVQCTNSKTAVTLTLIADCKHFSTVIFIYCFHYTLTAPQIYRNILFSAAQRHLLLQWQVWKFWMFFLLSQVTFPDTECDPRGDSGHSEEQPRQSSIHRRGAT